MDGVCGNIAAIACVIGVGFPIHNQCHFAAKNDVCGFRAMGVVGIARIWTILPHIGMGKAFALKLGDEFALVHDRNYSAVADLRIGHH